MFDIYVPMSEPPAAPERQPYEAAFDHLPFLRLELIALSWATRVR